ncbi:flavodoxin reductase [Microbacterium sp. NM3R9]|uniref:FAD-dependent oxidoreductase n=1 Tax=Microbacterium thalli TaxID=3027921 RepID=UPI0023661F98|nr:flavodoxin reductase [Microbacterium thalli]MDD7929467.1 flavodoxin reductase [Microbacterium thalli]MDN8548484.1 flavodoxin reductase [Microbacterium thalli]
MTSLTAARNRAVGALGRVSMYRLVLLALAVLAVIAFALTLVGELAGDPLALPVSLAVLVGAIALVDVGAQRLLGRAWRIESAVITALILLFVLRPTLDPAGLVGIAIAGAVASASKYALAWRGRHIFNPAAAGATALTVLSIPFPDLGASAWWVGTPLLALPVLVLGGIVLVRTEKVRVVAVFLVVAVGVALVRTFVQYGGADIPVDAQILGQVLLSSPFLFLGAFMLSEPLTLPPRRSQQYLVAALVGALAGWPILIGEISLGQERALLVGNLLAFFFAWRAAVRLTFVERRALTPSVRELSFRAHRGFRFRPGQYLELEVPHRRPDARGTRREFSIVSAPAELPEVRIALREGSQSSYKQALARVEPGQALPVTGVWGDFVLPARTDAKVLLVAAGIGVTPFVSQLRQARLAGEHRDIVMVYVASAAEELAFRDDIVAAGIPVLVVTRDEPHDLPSGWRWSGGARLDAAGLVDLVPDLAERHAYISGPPRLIAELAPALARARSLTTDAFAGY